MRARRASVCALTNLRARRPSSVRERTFAALAAQDNAPVRARAIANQLLAALPRSTRQALGAALEPATLAFGEILHERGAPIAHLYFPCEAMVSLLVPLQDHVDVEVALVGREGLVGASLALGIVHSPVRALVQGAGSALRLDAARFRRELANDPALRRGMHRYLHGLMAQIAQSGACSRFHVVEARLARRLLMTRDHMRSASFGMTHERIARMLGVRRVGVTEAASSLQRRKLIAYSRGNITIVDEHGLEAACCACYRVGRREAGAPPYVR